MLMQIVEYPVETSLVLSILDYTPIVVTSFKIISIRANLNFWLC